MALSLKHAFTSAIADSGDTSVVQPSNWNAEHTLLLDANSIVGNNTGSTAAASCLTASSVKTLLGLSTSDSPQFTAIELGNASDTTIARSAAGVVTIEGVEAVTLSRTQTLTNKTLTGTKETVYTISDGAAFEVDPANGGIQTITLGASRTPKATNFTAGQSVTLMVDDGTAYTLTWSDTTWGASGVTWIGGSAPTLATSGYTVIEFWKVGTKVYGSYVGAVA